jgi:hypothetical protein
VIKLDYRQSRPSFDFVARGNILHVIPQGGSKTACGIDVKECRQVYNVIKQTDPSCPPNQRIDNAKHCKKCFEAYHERREDIFPTIK